MRRQSRTIIVFFLFVVFFICFSEISLLNGRAMVDVSQKDVIPSDVGNKVKTTHLKEKPQNKDQHLRKQGMNRIEEATLPSSWAPSTDLLQRLNDRRHHVREECKRQGLADEGGRVNAWEYLIHRPSRLVWCNVFKAASSTWFWNFNLLANYTEAQLLSSPTAPVELARRRYPRPSTQELQAYLDSFPTPLSFMITRHPLLRLVSCYRNKILVGNNIYVPLFNKIYKKYSHLGPPVARQDYNGHEARKGSLAPSFPQFVQYVLDEEAAGQMLDMHYIPQERFCTPCQVNLTVFAKVETLDEDGSYIIFTSGINKLIKPKFINRSQGDSTSSVSQSLLCQLLPSQRQGLLTLYHLDLVLFQYSDDLFSACP